MDIVAVEQDAATAGQVAALHRIEVAVLAVDEPDWPPPAPEDIAAQLRVRRPDQRVHRWLALDGGEPVGFGRATMPLADNQHTAFVHVAVLPDRRRRGVGTALLRTAVELLAAEGRRSLLIEAFTGSPGAAFCDTFGFEVAESDRSSVLRLADVDVADVDRLAAAGHPGYRIVGWSGHCPDGLVGSYARAKSAMNDAPLGSMDWNALTYTAERMRLDEEHARTLGQDFLVVAAVHEPTGEIAGFTEIAVSRWSPRRAFQEDTAVVPAHRGNGLGLWVKAELLLRLRAAHPQTVDVVTRNGETNEHMWRINERLGFRTYATTTERQARVDELATRLRERVARPSTVAGDQQR